MQFPARHLFLGAPQFSHSVVSKSLRPHGLKHVRPPCPSPTPGVDSNSSIGSVMLPNHLILCRPLLLLPSIFPSIKVFSNESVLRMRWPKYWSFSFSISPSNGYAGLISFRMDWLDLLAPFSWSWCTRFCLCPPGVCFPVLCKFWPLCGGLMATSSKRAYATPRSAAPRAQAPAAGHCWPIPPQRHPNTVLAQTLWGPWALVHTRFVWALWTSLEAMGFDSKCDLAPPTILLGLLLCPWT